LASSFLAWLTAFSISIEFTCETMSNEGMAKSFAIFHPRAIQNRPGNPPHLNLRIE
jgi:hypothetical protein